MATKSSGSLDGDSSKSAGSLEKDPAAGSEGDAASGYDYSDSSGGGYSYDAGGSGGSSGSSGSYDGPSGGGGGASDGGSSGESGEPGDDAATDDDPGGTNEREGDGDNSDGSGGEDSGGDGADGGEGGSGDELENGLDDLERLPEEGHLPENEGPGDSEGPGGGWVAVDIDLMIKLIASMEQARDQIPELEQRMRTILSDLDIYLSETTSLNRVIAWIEGELPGLRRRLAIARALEEGRLPRIPRQPTPLPDPVEPPVLPGPKPPGFQPDPRVTLPVEPPPVERKPVIWDEDQVVTVEPHEAVENGRRAAMLIAQPNGAGTAEAAELLRSHQADPYFAREFASNTDPSSIVASTGGAEGGGETELHTLVNSTVATASQATGELAVDGETRDAWAGASA